jgi:hypothetical protein
MPIPVRMKRRPHAGGNADSGQDEETAEVERILAIGIGARRDQLDRLHQVAGGPEADRFADQHQGAADQEKGRRRVGQNNKGGDEQIDQDKSYITEEHAALRHVSTSGKGPHGNGPSICCQRRPEEKRSTAAWPFNPGRFVDEVDAMETLSARLAGEPRCITDPVQ